MEGKADARRLEKELNLMEKGTQRERTELGSRRADLQRAAFAAVHQEEVGQLDEEVAVLRGQLLERRQVEEGDVQCHRACPALLEEGRYLKDACGRAPDRRHPYPGDCPDDSAKIRGATTTPCCQCAGSGSTW